MFCFWLNSCKALNLYLLHLCSTAATLTIIHRLFYWSWIVAALSVCAVDQQGGDCWVMGHSGLVVIPKHWWFGFTYGQSGRSPRAQSGPVGGTQSPLQRMLTSSLTLRGKAWAGLTLTAHDSKLLVPNNYLNQQFFIQKIKHFLGFTFI